MYSLVILAAMASTPQPPAFPEALGLPCSAVYLAEQFAGSTTATHKPDPIEGDIAYSARLDGTTVIRGYTCTMGKISSHVVLAHITNETDARVFYTAQLFKLESTLGQPCNVFSAMSPASRELARIDTPELLAELQDTFEWRLANGMLAKAALYYQPGTKYWVASFRADEKRGLCPRLAVSPNKRMQRSVTHKVLGRGRPSLVPWSAPHARVLTGQRAGADAGR